MKRRLFLILFGTLFALSGVASIAAQEETATTGYQKYKGRYSKDTFEAADTDHDGYVSWDEARSISNKFERTPSGRKRFHSADIDKDGRISLQEARKYRLFEVSHRNEEEQKMKKRKGLGTTSGQGSNETVREAGSQGGRRADQNEVKIRETKKGRIEAKQQANKEELLSKKKNTRKRQHHSRSNETD